MRKDHELPSAIKDWGWRYHHLGIPTKKVLPGEEYYPHLKFHVSGFRESPYGVEWMRFDPDCKIHELIKTVPHLAFEVKDLDTELASHDFNIISLPDPPGKGIRVAMIVHNGAPVELIEFREPQ